MMRLDQNLRVEMIDATRSKSPCRNDSPLSFYSRRRADVKIPNTKPFGPVTGVSFSR